MHADNKKRAYGRIEIVKVRMIEKTLIRREVQAKEMGWSLVFTYININLPTYNRLIINNNDSNRINDDPRFFHVFHSETISEPTYISWRC